MSMNKKAHLVGTIEQLLKAVGADDGVKSAGAKRAEANTEAGGYMGATTHPVKEVDDRTEDAQEGARSAENTDDVKNEPNRGKTVDATTPGPGSGQESVQTDVGITSKATGDDPSAETDSAKDGKQDPGSSHPARTDNDALDGHKYASKHELLVALCKKAEKLGEDICGFIAANVQNPTKRADESAAGSTNCEAGGKGVADGPISNKTEDGKVEAKGDGENTAKQSGDRAYDLAGIFANMDVSVEDKTAADHMVVDTLSQVIETAVRRAEKTAMFYSAHFDPRNQKRAEGEDGSGKSEGSDSSDTSDESAVGSTSPDADSGAGATPDEEALLMELLQGGEGMGAGDAMGDMGGAGGGDPMGGGDPLGGAGAGGPPPGGDPLGAGAGGPPPGGDPMAAMGGGGIPGAEGAGGPPMDPSSDMGGGNIDPAMLQQILQELGITPDMLQQKISSAKKASASAKIQKTAKWQPKTAADREKYARMKQVITEIVGRPTK